MVCVNHIHLEALLATLYEVSQDFELRINPKKCAIFAVRDHSRITAQMNLQGIPVATEYCYLGVTIDNTGSINPQLDRMQQRSNYLRANMRYYVKDLSFEN